VAGTLPVSITALYNKLNGIEPSVTGVPTRTARVGSSRDQRVA
jgi:hypothetical protein